MSEKAMRDTARRRLLEYDPTIHYQRIEDSTQAGIPDINFCWRAIDFWVEAKQMDECDLPKRATTPVKLGLQPEQSLWLENRRLAGGRAYVLAKIGNRWLIFNRGFRQVRDGLPLTALLDLAYTWWEGAFRPEALLSAP